MKNKFFTREFVPAAQIRKLRKGMVIYMKCPYCQEGMQLGYIPNGDQPVQWIPDGERVSVLSFSVADKGVPLINHFKLLKANGYRAEAHYCAKCKVVIAKTER